MNNLVSEVYSNAFFELSQEQGNANKHKEDLDFVWKVLDENPKLRIILNNPNIDKIEKKDIISKIFVGISNYTQNFLNILIDKSRFGCFDEITKAFVKKYNEANGISQGIVYSTKILEKSDIENLEEILSKKFDKKVELKNIIDKELIGGISISIDGKKIDNSIKSRLENLRRSLKEERR